MDVEAKVESLIPRIKSGDVEAFEKLYTLTYKYVFKIAYSITLSKESAEDVVQNTYLKLFKVRKKLKEGNSILGYLKRIAINYAIKAKDSHMEGPLKNYRNFDEDKKEVILEALNMLNPKDRSILSLFYLDNMSTKEISFMLNESEESIRTRLHRARNKLKEVIENGEVWKKLQRLIRKYRFWRK